MRAEFLQKFAIGGRVAVQAAQEQAAQRGQVLITRP
jgi:hypothetical protein